MTKVLVLYYSMYGHMETMANAIAEGARSVEGAEVDVKRVPETIPEGRAREVGVKLDQSAPVAKPQDLADYDAIIIGSPTRYGSIAGQMRSFLDQTGGLWAKGAFEGKVGSAFASTATQHGGQETTLLAIHVNLLHFGMILVGLPYSETEQRTLDEITGGAPYGVTTIAGGQGQRQPSANELKMARAQGARVARIAKQLHPR